MPCNNYYYYYSPLNDSMPLASWIFIFQPVWLFYFIYIVMSSLGSALITVLGKLVWCNVRREGDAGMP